MLLHELVKTLNEAERETLLAADLPQRQKEVLSYILKYHHCDLPDTDVICTELGLSRTNLYRQLSSILPQAYQILVPEGGIETLRFLTRKFLRKHFLLEIDRLEAAYTASGNTEALKTLYEQAFHQNMRFPVKTFDPKDASILAQKHLALLSEPDPNLETFYNVRTAFQEIVSLPAKKKMRVSEMAKRSDELLDRLQAEVERCTDYRAKIYYNDARQIQQEFHHWDPHERLFWLYKNRAVAEEYNQTFNKHMKEVIELRIAEIEAYIGKEQQSLATYKRYHPTIADVIARGYLFVNNYIITALICKEDAFARQIVSEAFDSGVARNDESLRVLGITHRTLLALLGGEYDEARRLIDNGLKENMEGNFFLLYEVQLRASETALAFFTNDPALVHALVERHKKWIRGRRYSLGVSTWGYFFSFVDELAASKQTSRPIKKSTYDHFFTDFKSEWPHYARLFEELA